MSARWSKRLSDREKVLNVAHTLLHAFAGRACAGVHARVDQILLRSIEAEKNRRIHTISQVHPKRPDRRAVANTEANRMHHVVEILKVALRLAQGELAQTGIEVAGIVKQDAAHVVAHQREPELRLVEQERRATQRKTGVGIARPCLIFGKAAMRGTAAAEETLRQRNRA